MSDPVLLEPYGPLADSLIWKVEREAYRAQGIDGWRQGTVPHYITTNPFIAGSYASVLIGFLRDCLHLADYDPNEPIDIVELGAGPGRFGYHLLTQLIDLRDRCGLAGMPVRYVMSDLAESNVAFWQDHPKLKPLVEAGCLDFACFDIEQDAEIHLLASGDVLTPGTLKNPVAVVANYVFDSVRQDLYRTEAERLHQVYVAASSTQPEPDLSDPTLLERLDLSFATVEADPASLGLDAASIAVLDSYRERLGNTTVLWPSVAIGCLDRLRCLAGGRLLLLSGDKGFSREGDLLFRGAPDVVPHGTVFSLMVNFHAIGEWFTHQGGVACHPSYRQTSLNVSLCASGLSDDDLIESTAAYHSSVEVMNPDDFFTVVLVPDQPLTDLEKYLATVRLSRWDSDALLRHLPGVGPSLATAPTRLKEELAWTMRRVWDTYYPIGEPVDLAFHIGMVFHEMGWHGEAIEFLERSAELYGAAGETYYNIALCHYAARQLDQAIAALDRSAEFEASADEAKALRVRILAERDRTSPTPRPGLRRSRMAPMSPKAEQA